MDINKVNKQHGFTIIEVALVLAIAGLIFLVVFLALPALQNSQKDIAKRQDAGRVVSALQSTWRIITINSLEAEVGAAGTPPAFPRMWGICRQ